MIPLISIINAVNGTITAVIAVRLQRANRRRPSQVMRMFLWFYALLAAYWFSVTPAGLLTERTSVILFAGLMAYPLLYAAIAVALTVPFIFLEREQWATLGTAFVLAAGVVTFIGIAASPALTVSRVVVPPFVYWRLTPPLWPLVLTGAVTGAAALAFAASFLYLAIRDRANRVVYRRSLAILIGISLLGAAGIVRYVVSAAGPFLGVTAASFIADVGLLVIAGGIFHEHRAAAVQPPRAAEPAPRPLPLP
jgi:hypothetical protein